MTIAEFPIATEYGQHLSWIARHGFVMVLAGCLMFWATVGMTFYFAL